MQQQGQDPMPQPQEPLKLPPILRGKQHSPDLLLQPLLLLLLLLLLLQPQPMLLLFCFCGSQAVFSRAVSQAEPNPHSRLPHTPAPGRQERRRCQGGARLPGPCRAVLWDAGDPRARAQSQD